MRTIRLPFPYAVDPLDALSAVAERRNPVLLHGCATNRTETHVSILGIDPASVITVGEAGLSTVNLCQGGRVGQPGETHASAMASLVESLAELPSGRARQEGAIPGECGALIGYASYDLCTQFENIAPHSGLPGPEPAAWWGVYPVLALWDHQRKQAFIIGSDALLGTLEKDPDCERNVYELQTLLLGVRQSGRVWESPPHVAGLWDRMESSLPHEEYSHAIERILHHIRCGDIYQANLTQQFTCHTHVRGPVETFTRLFSVSPVPYSAYLDLGDVQILSTSPELFLRRRGSLLATGPIKGTRERHGDDPVETRELLASSKDAAEHIMIVDLERNDLGRICRYGTVRPTQLRRVETLPGLHHLVSEIEGRLRDDVGLADIFASMMPGGSITGAPKIRAMEIIRNLEPVPRGVYTGCIGFIEPGGDFELNVAIRSVVKSRSRLSFGVGGGIVADSTRRGEYDESLLKGRNLLCACM